MANITTQTIRVDLSTGKVIPTAYTHQNDTARTLVFDMYNGGMPYTMTGNTVKFAYKSPIVNGQYSVIAGASMASGTVSGNKVSVTLPVAYTRISGVGMLTMIITPTSGTVRPVNIRLVVQKSADGANEIAGASDFPATLDEIAENWLDENISIQIDDTLSVSGKAADAKVTGDEISELDGQIGDLKSDFGPLIDAETIDLTDGEIRGYYIGVNGNIGSTSGTFAYSSPIAVFSGKQYTLKAMGTAIISAICSCDSSGGNRLSVATYSTTDTEETFNYIPSEDGYIVVCYNYNHPYSLESKDIVNSVKSYMSRLDEVIEKEPNIIDISTLQIGKNLLGENATNRAIIDVPVMPNRTYYFYIPHIDNVDKTINAIQMSANSRVNLKMDDIINGYTKVIETTSNTYRICLQFNTGSQTATAEIFANFEPYACLGEYEYTALDKEARKNSMPWENKKLVWLGTSIPAAGKYDIDNPNSYPIMVGEIIGATVYNESVGSSALHSKDPTRINTNNPYGFLDNFEAVSRCITNSLTEQEWIINHFNDTNVFTRNVPSSLSDADKEFIRSCSWEVKLQKYFNANDFPDAWVIDHGHNDIPSVASEATYTAKESISGTQHNGYYSAGNFVESTASSYIEYDVTDELYVWISGTFGGWYDVYDIYDSDGNNIGFTRNATQTQVNALRVNVSNATTLRVSNINTLINTIGVEKLKYPTYNSLYSYNGAFDFIVNKILTYNPRARIIMIGEYENQKYPSISENQLIASQRWEFPLYKQWENLGWSQQPILVDGEYKSMLNIIIPDNLHPHSDTTGYALKHMANNIAQWLDTIA